MSLLDGIIDEKEEILWELREIENIVPDLEQSRLIKKKQKRFGLLLTLILGIAGVILFLMVFIFPDLGNFYGFWVSLPFVAIFISWYIIASRIDKINKKLKLYEFLRQYHSDDELRNYPMLQVITKRHYIDFEQYRRKSYPKWFGRDVSHILEYKNEFCIYNLSQLTDICKNVNSKKDKYEIGLYFDLDDEIRGDDGPHIWIENLSKEQYIKVLDVLNSVASHADTSYLFKKQKELDPYWK
ncbi:MAG: hypothetical protein GF311_05125 [Candidatus Lokiarchaeota archaeon]|nr:hypothetical protein [Candidatus Lokiarchaeota archaeon]